MSLHETELAKYQKMWARPEYRKWSPGQNAVGTFLTHCKWRVRDTVVDLGCGTGRAGAVLADHGLQPTLLDFCYEAIEQPTKLPIIVANLWELPIWPQYDWVFCVDVLEHIPEEKMDDVLRGIGMLMRRGGYLQIAMFEDGCGSAIGEKLHMTVRPLEWWIEVVRNYMECRYIGDDQDVRGNHGYAKLVVRSY